ncbi:hypothetical protein V7799_04735 [Rhizobium laguerreae]
MATEREVLEFIIVPPFEQRAAVAAARERFENYLANRFPGYSFRVGPFAPVGDEDEFCVLPLMNFVGDDGRSYMCTPPKRWFVKEVANACASFSFRVH